MLVVLLWVVAFSTNLSVQDLSFFDAGSLFRCSDTSTASGNTVSDVASKHHIAVSTAIQSDMSFLCCLL